MTDPSTSKTDPSRFPDSRPASTGAPSTGTPPSSLNGDPARRPFGDKTDEKDVESEDAGEGHKGPAGENPEGTPDNRPPADRPKAPDTQGPKAPQANIQSSGRDSEGKPVRATSGGSSI